MLLIGSSLLIDPFRAHLQSPLARMYRNVQDSSKTALALTTVLRDVKQKRVWDRLTVEQEAVNLYRVAQQIAELGFW